jgi:hypothetical protein
MATTEAAKTIFFSITGLLGEIGRPNPFSIRRGTIPYRVGLVVLPAPRWAGGIAEEIWGRCLAFAGGGTAVSHGGVRHGPPSGSKGFRGKHLRTKPSVWTRVRQQRPVPSWWTPLARAIKAPGTGARCPISHRPSNCFPGRGECRGRGHNPRRNSNAIRLATAFPCPTRRHGLDRFAPAHGSNRSAAEPTWGGARPSVRRAAAAVLLQTCFHQPVAEGFKDVRTGRLPPHPILSPNQRGRG